MSLSPSSSSYHHHIIIIIIIVPTSTLRSNHFSTIVHHFRWPCAMSSVSITESSICPLSSLERPHTASMTLRHGCLDVAPLVRFAVHQTVLTFRVGDSTSGSEVEGLGVERYGFRLLLLCVLPTLFVFIFQDRTFHLNCLPSTRHSTHL